MRGCRQVLHDEAGQQRAGAGTKARHGPVGARAACRVRGRCPVRPHPAPPGRCRWLCLAAPVRRAGRRRRRRGEHRHGDGPQCKPRKQNRSAAEACRRSPRGQCGRAREGVHAEDDRGGDPVTGEKRRRAAQSAWSGAGAFGAAGAGRAPAPAAPAGRSRGRRTARTALRGGVVGVVAHPGAHPKGGGPGTRKGGPDPKGGPGGQAGVRHRPRALGWGGVSGRCRRDGRRSPGSRRGARGRPARSRR